MKSLHVNRIESLVTRSEHCTDSQLHRLLEHQTGNDDSCEATAHLETCDECQARLESIAEEGVSLPEVRRFLGPPADGSERDAVETDGEDHVPSDSNSTADFLQPSDRATSLGRFGRYEVEEVIGTGGMSVVLKGFDAALNRYSAIKVLAPVLATSAAARERFSREAKSSAAVVHDHVVPIHAVDEEGGLPYFIMPLIVGESLERRVSSTGPLGVKEILRIGKQVAAGLAAAHAQGLVHRDIKPGNILLQNGVERVLITDFGLARAIDDASVTQSGVIAGTPQYMSPEQTRGDSLDHRSDLFSLGSVLYLMCTGRSPFRAETTMGVLRRISDHHPRLLREVNSEVPDWLEAIVMKLLAKKPGERLQSAEEVAELLGQWLAHLQQPSTVSPPDVVEARPQRPLKDSADRIRVNSATGFARRSRSLKPHWIVAIGALLAVAAVIFVKLGETTIRFEIDDPNIAVHFGEQTITFKNDGQAIHIRAGDKNAFIVTKDGDESRIVASLFELKKGQKVVLNVSTAADGDIRVIPDDPATKIDSLVERMLQSKREGSWVDRLIAERLDPKLMREVADSITEQNVPKHMKAEDIRDRVLKAAGLLSEKMIDKKEAGVSTAASSPESKTKGIGDAPANVEALNPGKPDFTSEELARLKSLFERPTESVDRRETTTVRLSPEQQARARFFENVTGGPFATRPGKGDAPGSVLLTYRVDSVKFPTDGDGLSILTDGMVIIPVGDDKPLRGNITNDELRELLSLFAKVHPYFSIRRTRTGNEKEEFDAAIRAVNPQAHSQINVQTKSGCYVVFGPRESGQADSWPDGFKELWALQHQLDAIRDRFLRRAAVELRKRNNPRAKPRNNASSSGFKPLPATFVVGDNHYFMQTFGRTPLTVLRIERGTHTLNQAGFDNRLIDDILKDPQKTRTAIDALETLLQIAEDD